MEKITTILAVVAAILIGLIVIFLVGRVVGVFPSGRDENEVSMEEDVTQEEEAPSEEESGESSFNTSEQISLRDVLGMDYGEAAAVLQQEGFEVAKEEVFHDTIEKGTVISQTPGSGEPVSRGDVITLQVSLGSEVTKVRVPEVIGYSSMDATVILVEAGLQVGVIEETTNSDATLVDKICYQSYSVGSYVEKGTVIDLKVSIGVGESTYSFVGSIAGPGEEDADYVAGTETTVILTTSAGVEISRTSTSVFPHNMNISGIPGAEDGVITFVYTVNLPASTTTNEAGETVTVPGGTEERVINRPVKFAKE
ncbi:MAG: PASTA domain-containing protein [Lachnospiraceae bacterium]|nr:PASTA domain-containing protein [Lachnospiraceae bacterium]